MRLLIETRRALSASAARTLVCATALFLVLCAAQTASATTFFVNTTADTVDAASNDAVCADANGACSLRAAISTANEVPGADAIILGAGTYTTTIATTNENSNVNGDFDIASEITITGAGAGSTIVQANAAANTATDRVFDVTAAGVATISGVTVRNGQVITTAERGGGLRVSGGGSLSLTNSTVTANRAFSDAALQVIGGGIYNEVSRLTLNNVDVTGNACSTTGTSCLAGGVFTFGSAAAVTTFTNSRITNNTTTATGTNASATGAGFTTQSGGAINITGSAITGNVANGTGTGGGNGAGLRFAGNATVGTTVTITDSTISNNTVGATGTANSGGGIVFALATGGAFTSTLTNVTIDGNRSTSGGAGVAISGATGTNTFNNCRITNNIAAATTGSVFGGGVSMTNVSTANFNNSVISGNTASTTSTVAGISSFGGGINYQDGTINFTDTGISGNSAANGGGFRGAGVSTGTTATATFNRSSVTGNTAGDGGGIILFSNGTTNAVLNLNNSTVGGNNANANSGVELFAFAAGNATANVNYSTIAGNSASGSGGGAANIGQRTAGATGVSTFNLRSSVVANNSGASSPDILGVITTLGYNLVENTSGGTLTDPPVATIVEATGDQTGVDPSLAPLAANSSATTQSYRPLFGSVLLDRIQNGVNGCGTAPFNVDQRGAIRPTDSNNDATAACEIGAFEVAPGGPTAGEIAVSGRALTDTGRGIRGVRVTLTDASGTTRTTTTTMRGTYRFTDVAAGETYVITAKGARYTFSQPSQVLNASEDTDEVNFVANPGRGR